MTSNEYSTGFQKMETLKIYSDFVSGSYAGERMILLIKDVDYAFCWFYYSSSCRSAHRDFPFETCYNIMRDNDFGLRLVLLKMTGKTYLSHYCKSLQICKLFKRQIMSLKKNFIVASCSLTCCFYNIFFKYCFSRRIKCDTKAI
jgi:hypothetical protein